MKLSHLLGHGLIATPVIAFSFGSKSVKEEAMTGPRQDPRLNLSEMLKSGSRLSDIYTLALNELQDLESEPLCHRIAARLLIGNCQLLDGKDEATILTDSGRQIRDFVDAYAASMAICDLERGRFSIPAACDKFREPTLAQLPLDEGAHLHVSTCEVDLCISGLGEENAAWTTWISYRHKALRFCEAARADQEKAQNILLYQRLIKVMAKLTYGVEVEMQRHMEKLELRLQKAGDAVQGLEPELDRLHAMLADIKNHVAHDLDHSVRRSENSIREGLEGAAHLQQVLTMMIQTVLDGASQVAATQQKSVELSGQRQDDVNHWAVVIATAAASAESLNSQIELSRHQVESLSQKQEALSTGLDRLATKTDGLSSKYDDHMHAMSEAKNMTTEILDTLQGVAANAAMIEEASQSRLRGFGISVGCWVPYIISPLATLLLGSYGLAPSAMRNLGLVALGEVIGFSFNILNVIMMPWMASTANEMVGNNNITGL